MYDNARNYDDKTAQEVSTANYFVDLSILYILNVWRI
jgi:hypothetical protein